MRLGTLLGYICASIFVLVLLIGEDEQVSAVSAPDVAQKAPPAPASKPISEPLLEATLPLPADKDTLLQDAPQPAAFTPAPAPTAPAKTAPSPPKVARTLFVTGSTVNVRATPEIANNVVGQFNKGVQVTSTETSGGWTKVTGLRAGKELSGWMSRKYVSPTKPKPVAVAVAAPKRSVAVPTSGEVSQARKAIIRQSLAGYSGNCPCPYNRDRAGRSCGKRSAWSRPGGYSPICYDSDVSRSRLVSYFARLGKQYQ